MLRENKEQRSQALVLLATKSLKALPPNLWLSGNKQAVCQLEKNLIHDHYLKVTELLAQHHSLPVSAGCRTWLHLPGGIELTSSEHGLQLETALTGLQVCIER